MAIHEKNKVIEFSYEDEDVRGEVGRILTGYDIVYDRTNPLEPLRIYQKGNTNECFSCHPNLLVEIVDFLRIKGVIESQISVKSLSEKVKSSHIDIPLPVITRKVSSDFSSQEVPPIASFDVANDHDLKDVSTIASKQPELMSPKDIPANAIRVSGDQGISEIQIEEMKKRKVLRTRVNDPEKDPQEAEREASSIRAGMKKNKTSLRKL